jgi:hypothetical protein
MAAHFLYWRCDLADIDWSFRNLAVEESQLVAAASSTAVWNCWIADKICSSVMTAGGAIST